MSEYDIASTTISDMKNNVSDYSVDTEQIDGPADQEETEYTFKNWPQNLGYYKKIPEIKSSIDALARWTIGKGFKASPQDTIILNKIIGYGEDTFDTILKNLSIVRQINGDAFAEIIRDEDGVLENLKPLDPGSMKIVVDRNGLIKRYEQISKVRKPNKEFKPGEILHLTKGRIADEIHGISIIESVENTILTINEAKTDYKKVLHRNVYPIKVWYVAEDNQTKINNFITKVENSHKDYENIFIPQDNTKVEILGTPPNSTLNPLPWIQYNSSFFYQAVGIPQIILGGSQEFNEATAKIAYLSFEQSIKEEQRDIEAQLWAQLAIRIELPAPATLQNEMLQSEEKNTGQMKPQPNDTTAGRGK